MAKKPVATQPWMPAPYDDADIHAMRALASGNANEGQQRRALDWIINKASGYYDLSFRPGLEGARATDFSEGKRFVGAQVVKLMKLIPRD